MSPSLAMLRGERVIVIPPAQGGWEVIVGTTASGPQKDYETAVAVAALRLGVTDCVSLLCPACGKVRHLEMGRLRCRECGHG